MVTVAIVHKSNSMGKGRGKLPPMQGRSPSSFKSNYPEEEMYLDDFKQKESLMNSQFSHPDDSWKTAASNSVFSPLSDGVYDNGQRMMSMGRGAYTSNNKQQPQQQKLNSTPEIPKEKYRFEDVTEELDTKVAAYISKRFRDLSCNSNYKLSTEMQLSLPFKLGQCAYCSRPSIYACSRCKAWYCCNSCRVDDYPQHKKICTPKKIIFDPAGNITFVSEPDEFASALEPPTVSEPPEFTETNSENGGFNTSYDCNSSQTNRSNDSNRENHRGNYKKERTSDSFNNKEQNQKNRGQGGGGQRINNRRSGGDRDQSNNHMDRSRGGANKGGGGGGKDRRSLPNRNQNMENNVYVRKTSMSPERVPNNKPQINDKILPVEPPLPHTKFSQVRVGALGQKKGEFWAYSMSNEAKQAEILMRLNQHCAEAPPIPYVEPGMLVCAPFDGDRYRGRVIKIDKSTSIVDIFFIDFGNLTSVKAGELCQMPSEIEAIPPLAHHFILGNSLDNPTIVEEETIKIKPVKQDLEGRWVVHLEGVPYSDTNFQEVTVLVTEKSDEYWVYKTEDLLPLCEMTSALNKHENVNVVEPVIGDIYVHHYNKSWCRAKVVSVSPLKIFYIDYGNFNIVEESELHPLPSKYLRVPPMAHKIKLVEGMAKECYNLNECSVLLISPIMKLDNGTSLVEAFTERSLVNENSGPAKHLLTELIKKKEGNIHVEKVMNDDFLTGCVITEGTVPSFVETSSMLTQIVKPDRNIKVTTGTELAAHWNNEWHRAYCMSKRDSDIVCALIDRGRVVIPDAIALLPLKVTVLPESGVRVIFSKPLDNKNLEGKVFAVEYKSHKGKKVHVNIEGIGEAVLVPWEPTIEEAGLTSIRLSSNTKVIISSFNSPNSVYLQSLKPQDVIMRSELAQDLAAYTRKSKPLGRKPLCGEFLAARYSADGHYYRAQIFKKEGVKYKVTFVDYGNMDLVSIDDMKPLPDELKKIPCCAVKVGLKGVPNVPFNQKAMVYLNELAADSVELTVTYEDTLNEVTLTATRGDNVNKVLAPELTPSWKQENFNPIGGEVYMISDLEYDKWTEGKTYQIAAATAKSHNSIHAVRINSNLLRHIECNLTPKITEYCESLPNETYLPRTSEVCLGKFHEDEKWYRAVCLKEHINGNASTLFYVDYGNYGEVLHKDIRKMIPDFMDTPVALMPCKVYGLPPTLPEEAKEALIDYYPTEKLEAYVVNNTNETPNLWIPDLQKVLSKFNITLTPPESLQKCSS